jgi:hypothetical protein
MSNPRNVLISGFSHKECEEFLKRGVSLSAWIRVSNLKNEPVSDFGLETYLHTDIRAMSIPAVKDLKLSSSFKERLRASTFDYFRRHYYRNNFLEYTNLRSWNTLDDVFYLAASFFYDLLTRKKIDFIISANIPHEGAFIVLFGVAKLLNIPTIMLYQSHIPFRMWAMKDLDDYGKFNVFSGCNVPVDLPDIPEKPFYMSYDINKAYRRKYWKTITLQTLKIFFMSITAFAFFSRDRYFRNIFRLHGTKDRYRLISHDRSNTEKVDLSVPYIYFPLGMQPEMTTDTIGLSYGDQLLAIEEVSAAVPETILVYVKENPKQTYHMRGESFYKRLNALSNVRYIANDFPSFDLIKNAKCVAQVTGTAGYEAALLGVPAICFGATWYSSLYGIFPWINRETLANALKFTSDEGKLKESYDKLTRKTYKGLIDHDYKKLIPNYDEQQALEQTILSICDMIDEY